MRNILIIFLMKESSKLYRQNKEKEKKKLTKRLGGPTASSTDSRGQDGAQYKRQNLWGEQFAEVPPPKQGDTTMKATIK